MCKQPTERLTPEECATVRNLVDAKGKRAATAALGMRDMLAVMTAAAGQPVHRLTVATIRAHLAALNAIV